MTRALLPFHAQKTLLRAAVIDGIGLHGGEPVRMTLHPAPSGSGIAFAVSGETIPARWDAVTDTRLNTTLTSASGQSSVRTVEHLLAACAGLGVDNLLIEMSGSEVPVADGSAAQFAAAMLEAGTIAQDAPRTTLEILDTVEIWEGDSWARLAPADASLFTCAIDFAADAIGRQSRTFELTPASFLMEIAPARTFGHAAEVERLRSAGLARGGSLDNAVVIGKDGSVLNPGGLRFEDEFVRHKILDAIGDLYLAGAPILGAFTGVRSGHALNNRLLRTLFATPGAWRLAPAGALSPDVEKIPA